VVLMHFSSIHSGVRQVTGTHAGRVHRREGRINSNFFGIEVFIFW